MQLHYMCGGIYYMHYATHTWAGLAAACTGLKAVSYTHIASSQTHEVTKVTYLLSLCCMFDMCCI